MTMMMNMTCSADTAKPRRIYLFNYTSSRDPYIIERLGDFVFMPALCVRIAQEKDGSLSLDCPETDLYATGTDRQALMNDLQDELKFAWHEYTEGPEEELHPSARRYRAWLLAHVKKAERCH